MLVGYLRFSGRIAALAVPLILLVAVLNSPFKAWSGAFVRL
ncbi:hypothetical protein SAMN04515695_4229 [Pseudovibrio sp. Tun.PSC04-5.I4]|nr:hypothetical protein SAMN04515695_4229 [Pseudovibrio sp. Tun.PSC04-5.I4]